MNLRNPVLKVLICNDKADYGIRIASKLNENNVYAYTRRNETQVIIDSIAKDSPDVVITDLTLKDSDAVQIMRKVNAGGIKNPQFIVISEVKNDFITRQLIENGAVYVLSMPLDYDEITNIVKLVAVKKYNDDCDDAELLVTNLIRNIGVPAHIKGYKFLRTAILECAANPEYLDSVTKKLYPRVAEIYQTESARVERAIRHAIEIAWNRNDKTALNEFFGCNVENFASRPTNSEFIALASDKLAMHLKRTSSGYRSILGSDNFNILDFSIPKIKGHL
jgi:two-component system response regulator (stage 0 sporulation protein A)